MKMSQFKNIIREVVREEVRSGLKELLGEVKRQPVQQPKPKKKQNYTKNAVLNEVLNETSAEDWETMGGGEYTSTRMGELMGTKQPQNGAVTVDGQQPDFLKKDYRELMKAVDKKQGK